MAHPELIQFVSAQLSGGVSESEVREHALKKGWTAEDVNGAFAVMRLETTPLAAHEYGENMGDSSASKKRLHWSALVILLVSVVAVVGMYVSAPIVRVTVSSAIHSFWIKEAPPLEKYAFIPFNPLPSEQKAKQPTNKLGTKTESNGARTTTAIANHKVTVSQTSASPSGVQVPFVGYVPLPSFSSDPEPVVTLTADSSTVQSGLPVMLTWTSTNTTSCRSSNGFSTADATEGSALVSPALSQSYTVICNGPGGSVRASVFITVPTDTTTTTTTTPPVVTTPTPTPTTPAPAAPTLAFSVSPTSIANGESSTLTWTSTNATACTASGAWIGTQSLSGTKALTNLTSSGTYTLTCTGAGGTAAKSAQLAVAAVVPPTTPPPPPPPVPTLTFSASPASIANGGNSTLTWSSANATACTASGGWTGSQSTSGTKALTGLTTNATYTLSCTGAGGTVAQSASVTVAPVPVPTVTLTASPSSVASGGSSTLTWTSTNATACTASGGWTGSQSTSGTKALTGLTATATYTLSCTGTGGTGTQSAPVTVTIGTPTTSGPIGTDAKTMANWDVVPRDIVETDRNIGILAYHINGIRQVRFSVNGGAWITVTSRALNPETNVEEYFFRLRPTDYSDGMLSIVAEATPNSGIVRTLPAVQLYNNSHHTLARPVAYISATSGSDTTGDGTAVNPFKTIVRTARFFGNNAEGATVYMMPGDYSFDRVSADPASNGGGFSNTNTMITLTPAPGISRDQVWIVNGKDSGISSYHVHLKNITLMPGSVIGLFTTTATNILWIEGSYLQGSFVINPEYGYHPWIANYQIYATESEVHSHDLGIGAVLERNIKYYDMWSQAITGVITALNVYVDYIDRRQLVGIHPDVDHFYGMDQVQDEVGIIRYKVTTGTHIVARGAAGPGNNVVYDKCDITSVYPLYVLSMGGYGATTQGTTKHIRNVYFLDSKFTGGATWDESPYAYVLDAKDVVFQNTSVNGNTSPGLGTQGPFTGVTIR